MVPGPHPFEELAEALRTIAVDPRVDFLERLLDGPEGFGQALRAALPDDRSQLVLLVDQFEELFTLADPSTAQAFLDALAAAVLERHSRVRVVVTLRGDFYDRPLEHHEFGELLRRGTEVITAMSPQELQRAIEGPAARLGVSFEPGLVATIVADVTDHAGALPLLQYALTELFDLRQGDVIEARAYHDLGGAVGALARRADVVYRGLDEQAQATTRQVMLRLVSVGDGEEVTRRRVLRQELTALGDPRVSRVLDTFGQHRLLAFDRDAMTRGPTVEIAHEALFSGVGAPRLVDRRLPGRCPPAAAVDRGRGRVACRGRGARLPAPGRPSRRARRHHRPERADADDGRAGVPRRQRRPARRGPCRRARAARPGSRAAPSRPPSHRAARWQRGRAGGRLDRGRVRGTGPTAAGPRQLGAGGGPSSRHRRLRSGGRSRARHAPRAAVAGHEREGGPDGRGEGPRGVALGDPGRRAHVPDRRRTGRGSRRPERADRDLPGPAGRPRRPRPGAPLTRVRPTSARTTPSIPARRARAGWPHRPPPAQRRSRAPRR